LQHKPALDPAGDLFDVKPKATDRPFGRGSTL